jgi:kynureninase
LSFSAELYLDLPTPYMLSKKISNLGVEEIVVLDDREESETKESIASFLTLSFDNLSFVVESSFEIITPKERGCQLSVFLHGQGKELFDYLMKNGVIVDWREPNVIRLAPAPFYCSYEDMYRFGQILKEGILK